MTDIVQLLLDAAKRGDLSPSGKDRGPSPDCMYRLAAAELVRLYARVAELEAALLKDVTEKAHSLEGVLLVPKEPTDAMIVAGLNVQSNKYMPVVVLVDDVVNTYKAMTERSKQS